MFDSFISFKSKADDDNIANFQEKYDFRNKNIENFKNFSDDNYNKSVNKYK